MYCFWVVDSVYDKLQENTTVSGNDYLSKRISHKEILTMPQAQTT